MVGRHAAMQRCHAGRSCSPTTALIGLEQQLMSFVMHCGTLGREVKAADSSSASKERGFDPHRVQTGRGRCLFAVLKTEFIHQQPTLLCLRC